MTDATDALTVARAYHRAWSSGDFDGAERHLIDNLRVEVPINSYPTRADFMEAVRRTGAMASAVHMLAELQGAGEALLLYDLTLPIGDLRVAEHFLVADGRITQIRHVHDTAALRAAGFGG
jgi:ketosteroid isomerase-like protein